jgi:hypothetical protein
MSVMILVSARGERKQSIDGGPLLVNNQGSLLEVRSACKAVPILPSCFLT